MNILVSMKTCAKCKNNLPDGEFHKGSCRCKKCRSADGREDYLKDPEKYKKRTMLWKKENQEIVKQMTTSWQSRNPGKCRDARKKWYGKNKEHHNEVTACWWKSNREKAREYYKRRDQKEMSTPRGRLNNRMACRVRQSLKGEKGGRKWEEIVGYTVADLREHLERLFTDGMTWENMSEWHIDHKIPISVFNFTKVTDIDFRKCWSLKNLQPLWKHDNIKKSNRLDCPFQPSLPI